MQLRESTVECKRNLICSIENDQLFNTSHREVVPEVVSNWLKCHDMQSFRIWDHDNSHDIYCTIRPFTNQDDEIIALTNLLFPIYRECIRFGGIPFHAALIEHDGKGVILAGRNGVGKSTCCSRLPNHWNALCDDEVLVLLDGEGRYRAHPFPTWSKCLNGSSEKTWNVQHSVPVYGVFFIEQSLVEVSTSIGNAEAIALINESASQVFSKYLKKANEKNKRILRRTLFNNSCEIGSKIPAFKLRVSLDGCFWEEIERSLVW